MLLFFSRLALCVLIFFLALAPHKVIHNPVLISRAIRSSITDSVTLQTLSNFTRCLSAQPCSTVHTSRVSAQIRHAETALLGSYKSTPQSSLIGKRFESRRTLRKSLLDLCRGPWMLFCVERWWNERRPETSVCLLVHSSSSRMSASSAYPVGTERKCNAKQAGPPI